MSHMDITFPNSPAHHPITGTCIWRPEGNPAARACGQLVAARNSRVCRDHAIAWQLASAQTKRALKAAANGAGSAR